MVELLGGGLEAEQMQTTGHVTAAGFLVACGGCAWGVGEGYCAVLEVLCFSFGRGGGNRVVAERRARQNGRSGSRLAPSSQQLRLPRERMFPSTKPWNVHKRSIESKKV